MGKGNRNRDMRGVEQVNAPVAKRKTAPKAKKPMPTWLKRAITIAVVVVLVLGIVAAILASNGTFKRWQVLVKSQTGEFTVNRQVATFLAWELEYYYAYMSWLSTYYSDSSNSLFNTYKDPDDYAFDRATASLRGELYDDNGNVISTPRDIIDDAMSLMINLVAVSDYAYEQGVRLEKDEWKGDLPITWYSGVEDTLPVTWNELQTMQYQYGYASMDLLLKQIFDTGMKEKDVKAAMELICMYEKYLATKKADVENATTDADITEYIKNNPSYFYTTDYLTYQTKDEALKARLEAATDVKEFREIATEDWFKKDTNYKAIYNMYVTGDKAEKDYLTIEGKTGDALKAALEALGTESVTYLKADSSNADKIHADLSKWLFDAKREAGETTLLTIGDNYYLLAFGEKTYDEVNNTLISVTVSQKKYTFEDGDKLGEDTAFKENVWKQFLIDLGISEAEAPVVSYVKALEKAEAFEAEINAARLAKAAEKLAAKATEDVQRVENGTVDAQDIDQAILNAVFSNEKLTVGTLIKVAGEENTYLVYVEAYNEEDSTKATFSYAKVNADTADAAVTEFNNEILPIMMEKLNAYANGGKVTQEKEVTAADDDDISASILEAIFGVKTKHPVGTVLTAKGTENVYYLICIESYNATDDTKVTFSYTEVKSDAYYQILSELMLAYEKDKVLVETPVSYTDSAKEGTYQHWMFNGANADNQYQSPVAANAIKVISGTKTEGGVESTVYDLYIVVNPLHLDNDQLVNGGYYLFPSSGTNGKTAQDYVEELRGKTGQALIDALKKIGVSADSTSVNNATVSETLFREDLDTKLGDWLFDDARVANDVDVVEGEDGKTYIAIYSSKTVSWRVTGKNYFVADTVNKWMSDLASHYTPNESVLNSIGKPAPIIETTATTGTTAAVK